MSKYETVTVGHDQTKRLLSECELDAVVGGFVIYGAEARGLIIDWAVASCSNNLREPAIPPDRRC